jgi:hypothetical protein
LLEKNLDKINWKYLSDQEHAISLLEKNLDKIDWSELCNNLNAIHLIEDVYNLYLKQLISFING